MTVARTAAEVLDGHVTLEVESIDRRYLNLYVPQLQRDLGVVGFFKQRGFRFASGAVMQPITTAFVASIKTFVNDAGVDLVRFNAGERKDDIAQRYLQASDGTEQILFVGVAQDKARRWTTEKRRNPTTGASYPWLVRSTRVVNHSDFYGVDDDFGLLVIKLCSYFPYNGKVLINGHHEAQRQATKAGIAFEAIHVGVEWPSTAVTGCWLWVLEQRRPLEGFVAQLLGQEGQHRLIPQPGVGRAHHPVVLVG